MIEQEEKKNRCVILNSLFVAFFISISRKFSIFWKTENFKTI